MKITLLIALDLNKTISDNQYYIQHNWLSKETSFAMKVVKNCRYETFIKFSN